MIRRLDSVCLVLMLLIGLAYVRPYACYLPAPLQQLDLIKQDGGYYGYEPVYSLAKSGDNPMVSLITTNEQRQLINPWAVNNYQVDYSMEQGDDIGPARAAAAGLDSVQDKIAGLLNELRSRQIKQQYAAMVLQRRSQPEDHHQQLEDNSELLTNQVPVDDTNIHLPAGNDPAGGYGQLSGPINDPADFEAALGQLTDKLNHELPNSINRSLVLDDLMASKLNDVSFKSSNLGNNDNSKQQEILNEIGELLAQREQQQQQQQQVVVTASNDDDDDDHYYGSSNSEYIDHPLALAGHQYVQGGAGEGRQLLGPEGTFENVQVIKSDHAVPSYCDPPNPCPLGYTSKDGCLEQFVNSASFSREYQAKQQCSCDNEHSLFNCAVGPSTSSLKDQHVGPSSSSSSSDNDISEGGDSNSGDDDAADSNDVDSTSRGSTDEGATMRTLGLDKLDTLARTIQNRFGDLASVKNLIVNHENEN